MGDFFERIFKGAAGFFVDSQHAITKRLGVGVMILGLCFIIDDQVGITYFYASSKKIEQSQRLASIIANDSIDSTTKGELRALQLNVLRRKGLLSQSWDFTKSAINSRSTQTANASPTSIIKSQSNIFLHVVSSSWLLLIIAAVGLVGLLLQKKIGSNEIAAIVLIVLIIGVMATAFSFAFSFIPVFFGNPAFNYLVNAILHLLLMVLLIRVIAVKSA